MVLGVRFLLADRGAVVDALLLIRREAVKKQGHQPNLPRVHSYEARVLSTLLMDKWCSVKTATDRAAEAIEAAEKIFADEMGATLDLTPAAKVALIATITAAIHAAVDEEKAAAHMGGVKFVLSSEQAAPAQG